MYGSSMSTVVPPPEEAEAYGVGPGSITWQRAGDARLLLAAGATLVLQVAHPTVAGGVREHSAFLTDPWGRLLRTLDYTNLLVYGGPRRAAEAAGRVRAMHKQIKGVDPTGRRYHALEPHAYAWVHATLAENIVLAHEHFGRPLSREQVEQFWGEWRGLGRLLGVRDRDLPETWAGFRVWFGDVVEHELEDNDVVQTVLGTLTSPAAPPRVSETLWRVARLPAARAVGLATVGLLPRALRERFGLRWSAADAAQMKVMGALSRATTPVLPGSLRRMGPGYLRWRGEALTF